MKKIININFHSRVIPIEETAYDILRKYVESLKRHFAGEEGGDEIVHDIENRFAELFSDKLKKGATCITDDDVNEIITSMGRPEDFDDESIPGSGPSATYAEEPAEEGSRRLYRSENDKMLGGVCGGLAAYLKLDPSVVRIIYSILILGSFGTALLLYFILWIVLPPKSLVTSVKKRLFRDPDHRVIAGVASGLAAYFNIEVWIPRVIFLLPLIAGAVTSILRHAWFDFQGPVFFTGGFGGTLFITYIILWVVLPEANTATEKLEMRGEKIDLASIKNTIKSDLEGFRQKATAVGAEMKQKAEQFGNEVKGRSGNIRREASSARPGIGHAIGVIFRAFFLFISVIITFALVMALIGLLFSGVGILPLKDYIIHGFWQNIMAWAVLLFFIILPVVALLTWLIRRIIGARRGGNYLGYVFGSLWVIGLVSLIFLAASISSHFKVQSGQSEEIPVSAPARGRMIVELDNRHYTFFDSDFMGVNWRHKGPFFDVNDDSLQLSTVRLDVVKSRDSSWHVFREKISRGSSTGEATAAASRIQFPVEQRDSVLILARGFAIYPDQQFRNQKVRMIIEMPVGRKIMLDQNLNELRWFDINRHWRDGNGVNIEFDDDNALSPNLSAGTEYIMTESGLERTNRSYRSGSEENNGNNGEKKSLDSPKDKNPDNEYRYHKDKDPKPTATHTEDSEDDSGDGDSGDSNASDSGTGSALVLLTRLS